MLTERTMVIKCSRSKFAELNGGESHMLVAASISRAPAKESMVLKFALQTCQKQSSSSGNSTPCSTVQIPSGSRTLVLIPGSTVPPLQVMAFLSYCRQQRIREMLLIGTRIKSGSSDKLMPS
mmetsp:Transcript_8211/g.16463  ORF Transcript_8211/g.16463 Transcript_8211/m.16463 type:complete len:122 (+) Transcript_8211:962-1327(+)